MAARIITQARIAIGTIVAIEIILPWGAHHNLRHLNKATTAVSDLSHCKPIWGFPNVRCTLSGGVPINPEPETLNPIHIPSSSGFNFDVGGDKDMKGPNHTGCARCRSVAGTATKCMILLRVGVPTIPRINTRFHETFW